MATQHGRSGGDGGHRLGGCASAQVDLQVPIDAPARRAWLALVEQTGRWWHRDFYTSPLARGFVIEARVGGRVFEDWGDGGGVLWGTVLVCEPGRVLEWAGDLSPSYGGPARTIVRLELEPRSESSCVLKLRDAVFGRIDEGLAATLESGWTTLFGPDGLKGWVEREAAHGR